MMFETEEFRKSFYPTLRFILGLLTILFTELAILTTMYWLKLRNPLHLNDHLQFLELICWVLIPTTLVYSGIFFIFHIKREIKA